MAQDEKVNNFFTEEIMPRSNGIADRKQEDSISPLKILFLTDNSSYQNVLQSSEDFFSTEANCLFLKMIQAMGLSQNDYSVALINSSKDWKSLLVNSCPQIVALLGASTTLAILEGEKLSKVRGQIIPKTFYVQDKTHQTKVVSLFHPDFLLINPAMKRTAWIDLQLIMKLILN